MSYKVQENEQGFDIIEKQKQDLVVIDLKMNETKARALCRKLNLGAGFNGFTPDFFASMRGIETK